MSDLPELNRLDRDGAIREHADRLQTGSTRRAFFGKAAVAGTAGGLMFGGLQAFAGAQATGAASDALTDVEILQFALVLEYLERDFYASALQNAGLTGELETYASTLRDHEAAHVDALVATLQKLGVTPVPKPQFDFGPAVQNRDAFIDTSVTLEATGVGAYQGAVTSIASAEILTAAASILPVEAYHTAWGRTLQEGGEKPAPVAFNEALSVGQVLERVGATGFITSQLPAAITTAAQNGTPSTVG